MRLISLAPATTEIIGELGCADQLVAVSSFCDFPPSVKVLPKMGGWTTASISKLHELAPELIFTSYYLPQGLRQWTGPGKVIHVSPFTLQDVLDSILQIGSALHVRARAERLVRTLKRNLESLQAESRVGNSTVYMEEWSNPPMVAGNWVPEMVEIAGGIPVLSRKGAPSYEYAWEQLQTANPDIIICHWCGAGVREVAEFLRQRPKWEQLSAVKQNRIGTIDDSLLNRPGPRLVSGIVEIRKLIEKLGK